MRRRITLVGFALTALLTGFFILRTALFASHWMDPDRGLHPVEGWMTQRYISRTYDIPRDRMLQLLDLPETDRPRQSLEKIAANRGVPVDSLIAQIEAALAARPPE
jgi:hypothetical protein